MHKGFSMLTLKQICGLLILFFGLANAIPAVADNDDSLSKNQRQEIEKLIHQYIMDNPRVILDAVERMQEEEQAAKEEAAQKSLLSSRDLLLNDPDTPVGGNPKGDVTVVEFFDYRCGFCKRVYPSLLKVVETDKNVRYVYKEFPILGPQSVAASKAALAVSQIDKSKYGPFHHALMTSRGELSKSKVLKIAADLGVDPAAVAEQMDSPEVEAMIRKNYELAQSLNITGTPAFVIGDKLVPGAIDYSALKEMIADARKG
jgi:protein-disulfide isomerase